MGSNILTGRALAQHLVDFGILPQHILTTATHIRLDLPADGPAVVVVTQLLPFEEIADGEEVETQDVRFKLVLEEEQRGE